jgi:hypothetical protein
MAGAGTAVGCLFDSQSIFTRVEGRAGADDFRLRIVRVRIELELSRVARPHCGSRRRHRSGRAGWAGTPGPWLRNTCPQLRSSVEMAGAREVARPSSQTSPIAVLAPLAAFRRAATGPLSAQAKAPQPFGAGHRTIRVDALRCHRGQPPFRSGQGQVSANRRRRRRPSRSHVMPAEPARNETNGRAPRFVGNKLYNRHKVGR